MAPAEPHHDRTAPPGVRATPLIVGVLGGIASGKSAVARWLAGDDGLHVDADQLAHAALDTTAAREWIERRVGAQALSPRGVERAAIARVVFADPTLRSELEAIVHPWVRERIAQQIESALREGRPRIVLDVPLLLENDAQHGLVARCDALVFVDANARVREERAQATRGWTPQELARREAAQMPLAHKRSRADVVIPNDGDWAQTASAAEAALRELERRRAAR